MRRHKVVSTDKTFTENVVIAVIVDLCKSFFVFCFALVITIIRRFLCSKARQYEKIQYEQQHPKETKDTIPDEELFE